VALGWTLTFALGFLYWNLPFIPFAPPSTEVWRYKQLVNPDSRNGLLGHFPEHVPKDATEVRFYYAPGTLQAGTVYQIRMRLPLSRIEELHEMFSKKKTKSFWGGALIEHMNGKNGMPTTRFYTNRNKDDSESLVFPTDYEIMIFDRLLPESERPPGFYWNHGESHGVAISKKRNEIVYWAEAW
jgi:hypothetical protein